MNLPRIAKVANLIGFVTFGAVAYFVSVPAAWQVLGVLCVGDAIFVAMYGSTEVFGQGGNLRFRGVSAYIFAGVAALIGVALLAFGPEIYCSLAEGKGNVCS